MERKPSRSRTGWAMWLTAQAFKVTAAGMAFYEFVGEMRPEGLGFAAFLLTVATSLEQASNSSSGGKG